MNLKCCLATFFVAVASYIAPGAAAEVVVGVTISLTGPGTSLAIPTQNAISIFPTEVGGEKVNYVVLDDGSDPTQSVRNFRKLVNEYKADVILGSSISPATLPLVDIAAETSTPLISLAASSRIVEPQDDVRRWTFKAIQNQELVTGVTVDHMVKNNVKRIGFIGFSDAYGESWLQELKKQLAERNIDLVAVERYGSKDTLVTAQVLKVMQAKPDAIFIAAAGTPGALPQKSLLERGFKGPIYQTYGIANNEFLRISGKDAEGALFAVGPALVASQLPDANPVKAVALDLKEKYEAKYGEGSLSVFVANAWDTQLLLNSALKDALKHEKPGSAAFRSVLRDSLENVHELVTSQGVMTMSSQDHVGYDKRAAVMVQIRDSGWKYIE